MYKPLEKLSSAVSEFAKEVYSDISGNPIHNTITLDYPNGIADITADPITVVFTKRSDGWEYDFTTPNTFTQPQINAIFFAISKELPPMLNVSC